MFVSMLMTVTAAAAMKRPLGSVTVPTIDPVVVCAASGNKHRENRKTAFAVSFSIRIPLLNGLLLLPLNGLPCQQRWNTTVLNRVLPGERPMMKSAAILVFAAI